MTEPQSRDPSDKEKDISKAKGTFAIRTDDSHYTYIRNMSGLTLDEFIAYLNKQGPLIKINSKKVISAFHIIFVEYDATYNNTYPEAEI